MDCKTNYLNEGIKITNSDGTEEIIQIPYNLNNSLIKEEDIMKILNNYSVKIDKVNHIHFFWQSFTHKSYCKKDIFPDDVLEDCKKEMGNPPNLLELRDKSYERLEYFGDRVIKLIVSMYLFYRYPNEDEGFMTRLQTKIEDKTNLSIMSKEIGLEKFFTSSKTKVLILLLSIAIAPPEKLPTNLAIPKLNNLNSFSDNSDFST